MTYVRRDRITELIPNKFEAICVAALECRRLNERLRLAEEPDERKITSLALERLVEGKIAYYDARERRELERSEAMLAAAEGAFDAPEVEPAEAIE